MEVSLYWRIVVRASVFVHNVLDVADVSTPPRVCIFWCSASEQIMILDGCSVSLLFVGRYEVFVEDNAFNLELYDAVPDDSGVYTCTATNDKGSVTCSCTLIVQGKSAFVQ